MITATKDPSLKPLHERPYTPGETWIIGEADPPGAPLSGIPTRLSGQSRSDTVSTQDKPHAHHEPRP
jgi:hypothetical protein